MIDLDKKYEKFIKKRRKEIMASYVWSDSQKELIIRTIEEHALKYLKLKEAYQIIIDRKDKDYNGFGLNGKLVHLEGIYKYDSLEIAHEFEFFQELMYPNGIEIEKIPNLACHEHFEAKGIKRTWEEELNIFANKKHDCRNIWLKNHLLITENMIDLRTNAAIVLDMLEEIKSEVIFRDKVKTVFGSTYQSKLDEFFTLKSSLTDNIISYDSNKAMYDRKRSSNSKKSNFIDSQEDLVRTLEDIDTFFLIKLYPLLKDELSKLDSKVSGGELELLEGNDINSFQEKVKSSINLIDKISEKGKKIWDFVDSNKETLFNIGKTLAMIF